MPEPEVPEQRSETEHWERTPCEVLAGARTLPIDEDAVIEELTDDEDRLFMDAIRKA